MKTSNRFPCSLPEVGASWFLIQGEDRGGSRGRLRWSAHPLGNAVCRHHAEYPAFALGISEVTVGFLVFCILSFIICPN